MGRLLHGNISIAKLQDECVVLSGAFAITIQFVLFVLSFLTLVLKWKCELPPRSFGVFLRDSSKQIIGSGVAHSWNLGLAMLFNILPERKSMRAADECSWYWTNIMLDTTVGVWVCYMLLRLSEKYLGYSSGKYDAEKLPGDNDEYQSLLSAPKGDEKSICSQQSWTFQILVWCVIVSLMKVIITIIMWVGRPLMVFISIAVTYSIPGGHDMRLIFVMIITPVAMNIFQFWVQDSFLKWTKKREIT